MKYVFSKIWNEREEGLKKVETHVKNQRLGANSSIRDKLLSGVLGVVSHTLGDKITQVALKSLQVLITTAQALNSSNLSS